MSSFATDPPLVNGPDGPASAHDPRFSARSALQRTDSSTCRFSSARSTHPPSASHRSLRYARVHGQSRDGTSRIRRKRTIAVVNNAPGTDSPGHTYTAYGLRVQSPIALPFEPLEFHPNASVRADVRIRLGTTPAELGHRAHARAKGVWESAPGALLLRMAGNARFFVSNGTDIVIERDGGNDHEIAMSMLGSVFGAVLQQRGIATFHASAVATSAGAVLFLGSSGTGKSTALAAMAKRGYAMLADDVTAVVLDHAGRPTALPAFPTMRLWKDSLDALQWRGRAKRRVREGMAKYLVDAPRFHRTPQPIRALFSVGFTSTDGIELRPQTGATACARLLRDAFRKQFLKRSPQEAMQFRAAAAMARQLPLVAVRRPAEPLLADALASCVEAHLSGDTNAVAAAG